VCGRPRSGPVRVCTACGAPFPEAVSTETPVEEPPAIAPHLPVTSDQPDTVAAYYPPGSGQAAPEQLGTPAGQQPAGHAAEDDPFGDIFAPRGGERGAPPSPPGPAGAYQGYQGADPRNLPPPAPPPRGRGKAVIAVLAAVVVLAAGGGVAFWLTHRHQAHGALAAPTTATSTAPQSPATPSGSATPSGPATPSASPGTGSEQAEVTQITPEIQQSASARKTVLRATGAVGKCAMVPSTGISLMNQAISQRQAAIGRMGSLSVNAIPNGPAMLTDLRQVLQHSITADQDFIGWMQDIQDTGTCPVSTSTDASFQAAGRADTLAVKAKKKLLALWNPIARKFGQPTFTSSEI